MTPTHPPATTAYGYWWCSNCKEQIGGYHVTNQEKHEFCGHPVEWITPAGQDAGTPTIDDDMLAQLEDCINAPCKCGCAGIYPNELRAVSNRLEQLSRLNNVPAVLNRAESAELLLKRYTDARVPEDDATVFLLGAMEKAPLFSEHAPILKSAAEKLVALRTVLARQSVELDEARKDALQEAVKVCDLAKDRYIQDAKEALETGNVILGHRQLVAEYLSAAIGSLIYDKPTGATK